MIDKSLFINVRKILLISIAVLGSLFIIEFVVYFLTKIESITPVYEFIEYSFTMQALLSAIIVFSLAAIYVLKNQESARLKNIFKRLSIISILAFIIGIFIIYVLDNYILIAISEISILTLLPFTLYVFHEDRMSRINMIMIIGFILSFVWKRLHLPFASIFTIFFCINIALGMIIYFFNCLFTIEKNKYLKLVSMLASIIIALGFLAVLFKFQHWPGAGILVASFYSPLVILTIIVLLTLPRSGFVSWKKSHREVLTKKLLLLWITLLLFGSLRYILSPQAFDTVFSKEIRQTSAFGMYDYRLEEKNGIVEDTNK